MGSLTEGGRSSEDGLEEFKKVAGNTTTRVPGNEPVGGQRVLKIDVGKDDERTFSPSDVRDQPAGTTVQFHFHRTVSTANHTRIHLLATCLEGGDKGPMTENRRTTP